ncbi:response regulator [Hellea balneolensis]|uniref:response regulator n=1 Tax=Hellea balneolensis TaxID=287478 RepID=UPI0004148B22|nr:response regulator [Hellea balneolensis]
MSPDDIFAAQIWPWPDPALKRDPMGRVLFVNAAFLQMYGGQVDDWRGNAVTGWPAPQPPGLPYRFETRLPSDDGEQVFDWMEYTMADGNAFAMARNVTYLTQTPDPDPGTMQQPAETHTAPAESHENSFMPTTQSQAGDAPLPAFAQNTEVAPAAPLAAPPSYQQQPSQEQAAETANVESYVSESHQAAESIIADVATDPAFESSSYDNLTGVQPADDQEPPASEPEPALTHEAPPAVQAAEPQEREYERRALPLENENAVLGNNWRDAVIAKAVGAEVEEEAPQVETVEPSVENQVSGDGPIRILLAEDNAINALLTRTLLEAEGHTVETVEDGALAVEAMKSSSYDLIFMDMRMPNMDGLEATRKIRAMGNVSKGLPIIALTANAFDDDRNACFDSGMNDFMTKPVSAEELSEMVRTWTKNKAQRDAA